MRRHILTLFAFLTGLSAFGLPAHAAMGEVFGQQVQSDTRSEKQGQREECQARKDDERNPVKREGIRDCPPQRKVKIYLPTVMVGSDRAVE